MSRCDRIRPDLSAFVDGTLPPKRWEQVSYHLAGCDSCRDEVREIARVCSTLSLCGRSRAPEALAARLESIAGEHASSPLYMSGGAGELPSARRIRVRRAAQTGAALIVVVMSVVVLAVLVAPDPVRITDPVGAAREQFSMSTAAISVNEAVGAVVLAYERGANLSDSATYARRAAPTGGTGVTAAEAAAMLQAATDADLTLSGVQRVWISDGEGGYRVTDVRTTKVQGHGSQLEVLDAGGDLFSSSFLPEFDTRSVAAPSGWEFSVGTLPEQVLGRAAVRVVASDDGRAVASWWIDWNNGLLLWSEKYDTSGEVILAVGYTELTLGSGEFHDDALTQVISMEPASSSQADGWCVGEAICLQSVGGLPLVAYSATERFGTTSMNLVYSDGFETVVVGWIEGVLQDGVTSLTDRASGMPTVSVWQSGAAVVSVTTNGSLELLAEVSNELPGESPCVITFTDRVASGLARLAGRQ